MGPSEQMSVQAADPPFLALETRRNLNVRLGKRPCDDTAFTPPPRRECIRNDEPVRRAVGSVFSIRMTEDMTKRLKDWLHGESKWMYVTRFDRSIIAALVARPSSPHARPSRTPVLAARPP